MLKLEYDLDNEYIYILIFSIKKNIYQHLSVLQLTQIQLINQ